VSLEQLEPLFTDAKQRYLSWPPLGNFPNTSLIIR
jgi:hypothetical protein